MNRAGSLYYYHANRLGSTTCSATARRIVERYAYSPYGTVAVSNSAYTSSGTVSSVGNPYLFTGRELDSESGLYNYRARKYDPVQVDSNSWIRSGFLAGLAFTSTREADQSFMVIRQD